MQTTALLTCALGALALFSASSFAAGAVSASESAEGSVSAYLSEREAEFDQIPDSRKQELQQLADYVRDQSSSGGPVRLTFVCTHNSRRSHMAMLWAAASAERLGIKLLSYSGGTESTAFNPRAVASIERAGFLIEKASEDRNPVYILRTSEDASPLICFSKKYDGAPNPKAGFGAVMVCDSADEACPVVPGAEQRFAITYVDPKVSDGTKQEAETYDERCAQIAREMFYMMTQAAE